MVLLTVDCVCVLVFHLHFTQIQKQMSCFITINNIFVIISYKCETKLLCPIFMDCNDAAINEFFISFSPRFSLYFSKSLP